MKPQAKKAENSGALDSVKLPVSTESNKVSSGVSDTVDAVPPSSKGYSLGMVDITLICLYIYNILYFPTT